MKTIKAESIIKPLSEKIDEALKRIEPKIISLLETALTIETNQNAKWAISQIIQNAYLAQQTNCYACQDCGQAVFFVEIGNRVAIEGDVTYAINKAVELAYLNARKSVADPLTRINTNTNTPAVIHYDFVCGDKIKISYLSKGAGSENMSDIKMLTPSKGRDGIINAVVDHVVKIGANPCPPIVLGIGIGGTLEKCAMLSKLALVRPSGEPNPNPEIAKLESEILQKVNETNIGAQGFGGKTTALAVHVLTHPTHIGMLPVAINVNCHSVRHATIEF